jgi:hypothetical protein
MIIKRPTACSVLGMGLAFILIILMSLLLVSKSPNFFDYDTYDLMMETGAYFARYQREPVSMVTMYISGFLEEGALGYYLIVWVMYLLSVMFISFRYYKNLWFTVSMFLLFNPLIIMSFTVPRHFMALTFLILAIHLSRIRALLVLVLSVLVHNILGLFALYFVRLRMRSAFVRILLITFGVILFYYFMVVVYPESMDLTKDQGRGQAVYALLFFGVFYLLMFRKPLKYRFYIDGFFFILILYFINPIAYRFFSLWIIMTFLYMVSKLKKRDSFLLIRGFTFLSVSFSFFIVVTGSYGYGPQ